MMPKKICGYFFLKRRLYLILHIEIQI